MSNITQNKWVAGLVNINPTLGKDYPYTFFEIDEIYENTKDYVIDQYNDFSLGVIVHKVSNGYHFFGQSLPRDQWKDWYSVIRHLNPKWPPLTLRITKKFDGELWDKPFLPKIWTMSDLEPWQKALMHFLEKERKGYNPPNLKMAMNLCGLDKYFKCVVYKIK